jgi:hypothetical protein
MKKLFIFLTLFSGLFIISHCAKDDEPETNIALTEPNSVSDVYGSYGTQSIQDASITVKSRQNGIVTYKAQIDINPFPESLKIKALTSLAQLSSYYKFDTSFTLTPDNKLQFEFKLKVTSDGYADYFVEGKEWVIGNYGDGVGTKYTVVNSKGQTLTREVTEKTGQDDWPFGFYYIKTSKIEQVAPAEDPVISKVIYRINHKFGLVYVEYQLKDGTNLKLGVYANFIG